MLFDIRYGLRQLRKAPGFAAVAILTLALGIGANTAVFSLMRAVFLAPLPFPDSDRLVTITERRGSSGEAGLMISGHEYDAWQQRNRTLESVALLNHEGLTLTGAGEPDLLDVARVSAGFFGVLKATPALGRTFAAGEDRAGENGVLVLSDALWRRHFDADPAVIGRTVTLDNQTFTVVGVMPPLPAALTPDAWAPIDVAAQIRAVGRHNLTALGRLRPGATFAAAHADLESISTQLARDMPGDNADHHARLSSLREEIIGEIRPASRMLVAAAGFVLLIGCANVTNLLLTRGARRQKEIAVRLALGAGRSRVIRQLVVEAVLVSVLGGLAGLLLAAWIVDLVPRLSAANVPLADTARLDWRTLVFAFMVSVATGILAGIAPALRSGQEHAGRLRDGTRISDDRQRGSLRSLLVGAEVALTMMLLLGAGLMLHSFVRLVSVDPGFHSDRTVVVPIDLPSARYPTATSTRTFFDRLLSDLAAIPGVETVGATSHLPLGGADNWMAFSIAGRPPAAPGQSPNAAVRSVTPGYFRTLGIPLVQGRGFEDRDARVALPLIRWYPQQPLPAGADVPQAAPVALVSEAAARQFWPAENPVGQRIRLLFSPEITIVGVVGDVRHNELSKPAYPTIYLAHNQEPWSSVSVVVRSASNPSSVSAAIRERVHSADPLLPVSTRTLDDVRAASVAKPRLYAGLAGLFSLIALALAGVGIVGVLGYAVAQRTREIGVRVALGAEREEILRLIVHQGMRPVFVGTAIGIAGGVALMRYVQTLLFEIAPTDPLSIVLTPVVMVLVALAACWIPARRAAALDPVTALRAE